MDENKTLVVFTNNVNLTTNSTINNNNNNDKKNNFNNGDEKVSVVNNKFNRTSSFYEQFDLANKRKATFIQVKL